MALIGLEIAVIDRNMIDNKKIEKRTEYNKHYMKYRSCLFTSTPCCLPPKHVTCLIFLSNSINISVFDVYIWC